jgi:Ca2+-binding RTX toxin-like protein
VIERLEQRALLSASLSDGVLRLEGSGHDDVMTVTLPVLPGRRILYSEQLGDRLPRNRYYNGGAVWRIEISSLGGDDTIAIHLDSAIRLRIDAGLGADLVTILNPGRSTVLGGSGNDSLAGGAGDDYISGGSGADAIQGFEGNDTLVGGPGADLLYGGFGKDVLRALDGEIDSISGDGGTDRAFIDFLAGGDDPMDSTSASTEILL